MPAAPPTPHSATEVGKRIASTSGLIIAGERLNAELLRRFYAAHRFEPVWPTRQAQANSLLNAVLRAGDHGLAPELFHANLLRNPATLPPLDHELLLSNAFLSYADALARGAMPIERRMDDEALTPEPIDVAATLNTAIGSPDPAAVIEALAPTTPTYQVLRQALQNYRSGSRDNRRISHGCVRVENAHQFAALLMRQPIGMIHQAIATGGTTRHNLPAPVSTFLVYQTVFIDTDGTLQFRPDVYNCDAEIWPYLHPVRQPPLVEGKPPGQRRG